MLRRSITSNATARDLSAGRRPSAAPLAALTKRRVSDLARALGAADHLVMKVPTADLETLTPQLLRLPGS
ncbi:hypothetical protein CA603_33680 [Paraburkholderia hospita]|nr:hypothetical protein CA603_33680 [Paraburkholderia hospita]